MSKKTQIAGRKSCSACKAAIPRDARFCPQCGVPVGGGAAAKADDAWNWKIAALVGSGVVALLFGGFALVGSFYMTPEPAPTPIAAAPRPAAAGAPVGDPSAVDLSTMTPREAADRLFNRIMAADEHGNKQQALQFAPMALAAYQRVAELDDDAHYHIGLINLITGDATATQQQIDILQRDAPNHLLALILSYRLAEAAGDKDAEKQIRTRFDTAYDAEIAANRPEYEAHRPTIEEFRTEKP